MNLSRSFKAQKLSTRGRAAYRVVVNGKEFTLVRSTVRPDCMYVVDEKLNPASIAGVKVFTDAGGEVRGVR